jgi:hypothetical protein
MPQLSYSEILERVKSEGGLEAALKGTSAAGSGFGGEGEAGASGGLNPQDLVGRSIEIEVQQLPTIDYPMEDLSYSQEVSKKPGGGAEAVKKILSIKGGGDGGLFVNNFTKTTGQVIINSSRVLINADKDYLMLFGKNVAIASTGPVNIDSSDSVTLFGERGLFLGVPNKGESYDPNVPKPPTAKSDPIPNQAYEPLVLGSKLAELLDDMLVILKNANIITPIGKAYFLEDTQYELACLQSRIPELLSTYAYVDGVSHQQTIKPAPTAPEKVTPYPTKLVGTITAIGDTVVDPNVTNNPPPTNPISSPLKDVPGFYDSVDNLYNIPGI